MAEYLPRGPLAAYLGVRNTNENANLQQFGLMQKFAEMEQARQLNEQFRRDQLGARTEAAEENRALRRDIEGQRIQGREDQDRRDAAHREAMIRLNAQLRPPQDTPPVAIVDPKDPTKTIFTDRKRALGNQPAPKTSIAGSGTFTPQTLQFVARQYLTGDRQAVQGFARNATARIALQNAIVDEAMAQGLSPEQTAAKIADFAGIIAGSRTVGQRAANISLAATEAQEMIGIVKESSDAFSRTQFVPWNMALRAYDSGTGSPEIAAFGASLNALVNVYARAINPTGQPTVSDKEHARDVINTVQSPQQVDAVLRIINRELEIAKKAPQTVRDATRQGIVGGNVSDIETKVKEMGWPYEPIKYEYRVQDGKVQRRLK